MKSPSSWNRLPQLTPAGVVALGSAQFPDAVPGPYTLYGNGRSYSDVCLTDDATVLKTRRLDRFISFDRNTGLLTCQPGVTLQEILALCVPEGWFLPVTPGTRLATVGGAIANDVHGKNHHVAGSFGHHVHSLELLRTDGEVLFCSQRDNPQWFAATVGGLGLTGLITKATLQLVTIASPWMWVLSQRFDNVDEFWQLNSIMEPHWPYTVAWIDCLATGSSRGRGIYYAGKHTSAPASPPTWKEKPYSFPVDSPVSLVNKLSLQAFNAFYYRKPVHPQGTLSHYVPYFYPLDAIQHWNRLYGRNGFYQYQCVLPPKASADGMNALLKAIAASGQGSFLAVLKTFGDQRAPGMLSFARPGATLALDFPNAGASTLELFKTLDAIVCEAGGALYPAKDARMPGELFRQAYESWEDFSQYVDPQLTSHFWKRVTS